MARFVICSRRAEKRTDAIVLDSAQLDDNKVSASARNEDVSCKSNLKTAETRRVEAANGAANGPGGLGARAAVRDAAQHIGEVPSKWDTQNMIIASALFSRVGRPEGVASNALSTITAKFKAQPLNSPSAAAAFNSKFNMYAASEVRPALFSAMIDGLSTLEMDAKEQILTAESKSF